MSEQVPPGSAVITPTQMYNTMVETRDEVRRLATVVDPTITQHGNRLDRLERWRWLVMGAACGAGFGGGYLSVFLGG